MLIQLFPKFWSIEDTNTFSNYIFIYGDNDKHIGCKGQAIIRYQKNAYGIPTKKYPAYTIQSYYTDDEYELNVKKIDQSIDIILDVLKDSTYIGIFLPQDGLGTGLADLPHKAPLTYKYLMNAIDIMQNKVKLM